MKYSLSVGLLLGVLSLQALAARSQVIEMSLGNLQKITVVNNGTTKTYQFDPRIKSMQLSEDRKSLSLGIPTKCDSYIGFTTADQSIQATVINSEDAKGGSARQVVFAIPKGSSVVGHCGTKGDELLSAVFYRVGEQKFWLKDPSQAHVIGAAEQAEINGEAARQARISKALGEAQKSLQSAAYAETRNSMVQLSGERLSEAQEKQLEKIRAQMPQAELSALTESSPSYAGEFQRRFHQDLTVMSLRDLKEFTLAFADGKVKAYEVAPAAARADGAVHGEDMTGSAVSQLGHLVSERGIRKTWTPAEADQIMQALQKISDMAFQQALNELAQTGKLSFDTGWDAGLSVKHLADFMQTNQQAQVYVAQMQKVIAVKKSNKALGRELDLNDVARYASYSISEFNLDVPGLKEVQELAARR